MEQIEYGILATGQGVPVAVRVVPGNTTDPAAFTQIFAEVKDLAGVEQMVMVGGRGMITSARIQALKNDAGLDHLPTGPGDRRAGRRGRTAADVP